MALYFKTATQLKHTTKNMKRRILCLRIAWTADENHRNNIHREGKVKKRIALLRIKIQFFLLISYFYLYRCYVSLLVTRSNLSFYRQCLCISFLFALIFASLTSPKIGTVPYCSIMFKGNSKTEFKKQCISRALLFCWTDFHSLNLRNSSLKQASATH